MHSSISTVIGVITFALLTSVLKAQTNGDQMTDGIGETSLIARYRLNGDSNDSSRNGLTAKILGNGTFIADERWGKILSLPGTPGSALFLPCEAVANVDSLSVMTWVRLSSTAQNQKLFDLGQTNGPRLLTTLNGDGGFAVDLLNIAKPAERLSSSPDITAGHWTHICLVFDGSARTVQVFVDAKAAGQARPVGWSLDELFDLKQLDRNVLRIGESAKEELHDVRLYSVALTKDEIARIVGNAQTVGEKSPTTTGVTTLPTPSALVDFGGQPLVGVPDIEVSTPVGQLPNLPAFVTGSYAGDAAGPAVRVMWPSPQSADAVQRSGSYVVTGRVPGTGVTAKATVQVLPVDEKVAGPVRALESFSLSDVSLDPDASGRDTPYIKNRNKFLRALSLTNPDDFLYMFRDAFGQPQPAGARPLGVWDAQTVRLRGHATGHYLSALAQAYGSSAFSPTLRQNFLNKLNYTVDVVADLASRSGTAVPDPTKVPIGPRRQGYDSDLREGHIRTDFENWGKGYISAYPPDQFILLEQGASYGTKDNQIWAPYYTLHKILAGLLDCYEIGGNQKALEVARGMGLWCYERLRVLTPEQRALMWNRYIAGEFGGMNEVLARLARVTGDKRLLDTARLFDNSDFFYGGVTGKGGLAANVDTLRGKHANQHIPQVIGALETYSGSGEAAYFKVAEHFWDIATTSYAYSIGGVAGARTPANAECFTAEPNSLAANGFSEAGQNETCATYNLLKLSRGLFMFRPADAKYMDYYERAMLNDILASVAENDAGNTYHIPLNAGARKSFGNAEMNGFTCCNGTALESNTKLQDTIYLRRAKGGGKPALYVNLFVPSTLRWIDQKATLKQETDFPYADHSRLIINGMTGVDLLVRVPSWATNGFHVTVNSKPLAVSAVPGSYADLGREWKDGDVIKIQMPFAFRLDRIMDQPNLASICYGPVVLAAEEPAPLKSWRQIAIDCVMPSRSIKGDASTLRFESGEIKFKPFFECYGRYSVYFDVKPSR